jgi:hypothetical protein
MHVAQNDTIITINHLTDLQSFKTLCNKEYNLTKNHHLKTKVVYVLCLLEMVFPPSFFDLMTNLVIHLINELDMCEPMHVGWMLQP